MNNKKLLKVLSTSFALGTILMTSPTFAEKVGGVPLSENVSNHNELEKEAKDEKEVNDEKEVKDEKDKKSEVDNLVSKETKSDKQEEKDKNLELTNDDDSKENSEKLELSSDAEKEAVKAENNTKSTRGLDELKKLDYKNFSKERQQFLEKLASAVDNVPYKGDIHELSKDPEAKKYYTKENPDSLTCSEFMSWGLYQSGHKEVENHYVRDFYADTKSFTHLSDKDTLMPGDFILDYTAGNRTGHILAYAGKDANGVEYLMHSQKYEGFNPNEKTLQNGPNIVKRSEYKVINKMPIYVRYSKFSDVENKKDTSGVNYADETNKNEIGKFQINDIKVTQAKDPNKESYFEDAYRFNISFSSKEKIKDGETLTLDGYYPKLHNNDKNEDYFLTVFPYTSKSYDEKSKVDIKIKNGNNEVVIGQMVGNKITFNKNAENFDKVDFTIGLGFYSSNRLNVEPEGRQELYEVPFYLTINGKRLDKPYKQKIKPSDRIFLKYGHNVDIDYGRMRLFEEPEEGKDIILKDVSPNPYKVFYDLAMNDAWKDAKVQVKMILPEGLEFKDNQTYKNNGIFYYSNEKTVVLADNKNINRHYHWEKGIASIDSKVVDKQTGITDFHINEKPLTDKENFKYDWAYSGLDIKVTDKSLLDLENKQLKSPIKIEYYVNGKLADTINFSDIQTMFATSSGAGGSAISQTKEETKTETIKFSKKTRETKDLEEGKTRVVQKGVDGEKTVTYKVTYEKGKEIKREKVSEKITKKPVDEITEIGTKKVIPATTIEDIATTTKTTKETIKADVIYEADDTLEFEKQKEVKKAVDGEKEITSKTKSGKTTKTEKVIKDKIDGLIKVGNKKVDVKTKDGITTTTTTVYEVEKETGKLINPKVTIKKTAKLGTIENIAKQISSEDINYETIYVSKADLEYEKQEVFQKGVKGTKEITQVGSEKPVEKITKKPVDEIIGVGNKKVVTEDIKIEGKDAKKITTTIYEVDKKTGKLINPKSTVKTILNAEKIQDIAKKTIPAAKIEDIAKKTIPAAKIEDIAKKNQQTPEEIDSTELKPSFTKDDKKPEEIDSATLEKSFTKNDKKPEEIDSATLEKSFIKDDNNYQQIEQAKKPEPKQNKTPEKMPKAGIENEITLLAAGALSTIAGLATLKKKRR